MKRIFFLVLVVLFVSTTVLGAVPRIALLDFEDETGSGPESWLVSGTTAEGLAAKAAHLLARRVVDTDAFSVVDRRDFTSQLDQEFLGLE